MMARPHGPSPSTAVMHHAASTVEGLTGLNILISSWQAGCLAACPLWRRSQALVRSPHILGALPAGRAVECMPQLCTTAIIFSCCGPTVAARVRVQASAAAAAACVGTPLCIVQVTVSITTPMVLSLSPPPSLSSGTRLDWYAVHEPLVNHVSVRVVSCTATADEGPGHRHQPSKRHRRVP